MILLLGPYLVLAFGILTVAYPVSAWDLVQISHDLNRLDPDLKIIDPEEDIVVLHPILTDRVLPDLASAQIMNQATVLRVPTDMLQVAQALILRRMMYRQAPCFMVRSRKSHDPSMYVLIVSLKKSNGQIHQVLDRRQIYQGTWSRLTVMNNRFPNSEHEHLTSFSQLEQALRNPASIQEIQAGIDRQSQSQVAELGGIMTITHISEGPPLIKLYFVQSEGEDFIRTFKEHMSDWRTLVELMRDNPAEFAFDPYQYRACLKTMELDIPEEKKEKRVRDFADLYLFMAKNSYCPDSIRYISLLADENTQGLFVADFHIHPPENEVSYQDKENSKDQRVIVIIPRTTGFDLVDLVNVPPHTQPGMVIHYPPHDGPSSQALP